MEGPLCISEVCRPLLPRRSDGVFDLGQRCLSDRPGHRARIQNKNRNASNSSVNASIGIESDNAMSVSYVVVQELVRDRRTGELPVAETARERMGPEPYFTMRK